MTKRSEAGFTIIELLIAMTVLATMLVIVTLAMTSIGNLYYKGVNASRVQDDTRTIANQLSQDVQLSNGVSTGSTTSGGYTILSLCTSTVRYSYIVGVQIGSSGVAHALWRDNNPNSATCSPVNITTTNPVGSTGGVELIAPHSRLTDLSVSDGSPVNPGLFTIDVAVAYGDDDLLNLVPGTINSTCKGQIGDQFCATSSITTTVVQRLRGSN